MFNFSSAQMPITRLLMLRKENPLILLLSQKTCVNSKKTSCFPTFSHELLLSATSFTDYAYAIANQTRARPRFLSTLYKSGQSPTQNLGKVSLGRAQVSENFGRACTSLCSVDKAYIFVLLNHSINPFCMRIKTFIVALYITPKIPYLILTWDTFHLNTLLIKFTINPFWIVFEHFISSEEFCFFLKPTNSLSFQL